MATLRLFSELDTLLNHVACKLVLREHKQLRHDHVDHTRSVLLLAIFNDVLDHVVSELVRDEGCGACMQLSQDRLAVVLLAVFQHPLDDSAAIRMGSKSVHLSFEGVDDELHIVRRNPLDGLLDHVVAILISDTFQDMAFKLLDHGSLLISEDMFQCLWRLAMKPGKGQRYYLLNHSTAVHLRRQCEHMSLHLVRENLLLCLVPMLKQLLNNIVAKDISHQLQAIRLNFAEHLFLLIAIGSLQLLLDETRSVLITTELDHMIVDVLQGLAWARKGSDGQTFNSYRLLPLLLALNSSNKGLRTTWEGS